MAPDIDPVAHNRGAWDRLVSQDNEWTQPVTPDVIARARVGDWSVVLIGHQPVAREWFPEDVRGLDILGLAAGGGQQGPVLAAAGANVTVLDNSPAQLAQDRLVADRDGLTLRGVLGDMQDLSQFEDQSFDMVFHPVSNLFCPDVRAVWRECFRVLRPGGLLLAGFLNPDIFIFDQDAEDNRGELVVPALAPILRPDVDHGRGAREARRGRAGLVRPHDDEPDRRSARGGVRDHGILGASAPCVDNGAVYAGLLRDAGG